ncbi:replication/maintenance protein RepL [Proteiniclasticum sp. C24MP]|uniref:replication/maintenance protein RepL n=1 Tax=Proteiniclasticum sp. C24MP TaxID=3374101 RepID=UPI0037541533
MPKINQSIETNFVDVNGEIYAQSTKKVLSWGTEPPFIKLYLQDILYLSDIPNKHERVLYELLKRVTYAGETNGMEVVINSALKRRIAEELGFKNIGSISNAITDLVKGKIIIRRDTGIYQFNPYFFGKGDWQDIAKLRLEVNYDEIRGRTFKTTCEFHDELKKETEALLKNGTEG